MAIPMVTMIWRNKQWISMKYLAITAFLSILVSQLSETL